MDYINRLLHRNSPNTSGFSSPEPESGNEASSIKADHQHDIKVRFIREFADANSTTVRDVPTESSSLSSASSFQSLASTLSSKCSSGICVDSSPSNNADRSYLSADISGLDDLISACENIRLNDESLDDLTTEQSFDLRLDSENQSLDQTFKSATDQTRENLSINSPNNIDFNVTRDVEINNSTINCPNEKDFCLTRDSSIQNLTINLPTEIDLDFEKKLSSENLPINFPTKIDLDGEKKLSIENLPINFPTKIDLDGEKNLSIENLPINCPTKIDLDGEKNLSIENLPINCPTEIDLDGEKKLSIENLPINCPTEIDLDVEKKLSIENLPINCPTNVDLDITRDLLDKNSSINRDDEIDLSIDKNLSIKNLPINSSTQVDLDITRDLSVKNSSINPEKKVDLDLTKNLTIQDLPTNLRKKIDLEVTKNLPVQNLPINEETEDNPDLDLTRDLIAKNSLINCSKEVDPDLDLTKDLSRQKLEINCSQEVEDLDLTRDLTRNNFGDNCGFEELEKTRTIDGETEASLANSCFESQTLNFIEAKRENYELACKTENFIECVKDQRSIDFDGSLEILKKNQPELAESLNSASTSKFSINENESRGLRDNEDPPLELIPPSLSDFLEKFESLKIEINLGEPEKSPPVALERPTNLINDEISRLPIDEFTENSQFPSLPSLSSLSSHLNEIPNLPNEPILENLSINLTQASSEPISDEKFTAFAGNEFNPGNSSSTNSLSTIQEPTFLNDENFVENSNEWKNEELKKLEDSLASRKNNPLEIVDFQALEIEKKLENVIVDVEKLNSSVNNLTKESEKKLLPEKGETIELKPKIEAEIEKEIFYDSNDKEKTLEIEKKLENVIVDVEKLNSSVNNLTKESEEKLLPEKGETIELKQKIEAEIRKETFYDTNDKEIENSSSESGDLNATLTLNDISLNADDILAAAESDQFAKFVPQQQSTEIVLPDQPKLENFKSGLVAGASSSATFISRPIILPEDYAAFVPQKQSTNLANFIAPSPTKIQRETTPFFVPHKLSQLNEENLSKSPKKIDIIDDRCNFTKLEAAANSVANDIFNTSLELAEDVDQFVSAKSELFHDPTTFDFLLSKTPRKNAKRDLRAESLYVNFDPLVSNTSMLPQGNIQNASPPVSEARNGENNTTLANIGTPKRNPAIAAIDRLLFYSPMSTNVTPTNTNTTIQKTNDTQEKCKSTEETSAETINMAKELELVRTTVLQLEEQLEKLKIDHEEALEKQTSYKDKINQLQAQLAQEIKNKNEITVVVDEYEISISRLVAERERDRKNLDLEKAKLQEELAAAKHHLDNTEAAFNDVHLKYERLKAVVSAYKSNETALKESIQENVEIIKSLENRYEQVKSHATAKLEKANQDLEAIRKQHDSETVRLHAMLRKAELKSNSLAELVEQKIKENKELTQILDEVIARVGRDKSE